jgi:uncharacterized protein (TIGR02172 family)
MKKLLHMVEEVQRIDLNDYVQTGEGGTALTYNHKDGKTLAKLFMPSMAADNAVREFRINQVVYESGLPTPQPIRLITDGERFGAEYELISPKRSFTRIISQEPDQLMPLSERFARLTKRIHQTPADTTRLPDMRELVREWIDRLEQFPDELKRRFHRFIDTVPSTPTCLHGDLHIGNIITDGQRDLWIDVGDFAYGVPEWDLGMMYYSANFLSAARADSIFHLDNATLRAHWDAFAPVYYGTDSREVLDAEVRKLHPYIAAKLAFIISKMSDGKHAFSGPLLQIFDKYLPE